MTSDVYPLEIAKQHNLSPLQVQAVSAGIPVDHINGSSAVDEITVFTTRDLTQPEHDTMLALVAGYDGGPRRPRPLWDILVDVRALSGAQKTAIWADLMSGSPPKMALDYGPNAASIFIAHFLATTVSGLETTEKGEIQMRTMTFYTQDQDGYLVHPSFDPSINVPSSEPVP